MYYPRMILFDYGHTLLAEPGFDPLKGNQALLQYTLVNKRGLTAEAVTDFSQKLFAEMSAIRKLGWEIHEHIFQRLLFDFLEIDLSISLQEAEKVFWDAAAPGARMPGTEEMLAQLDDWGIRSGVISNISFSGKALAQRIHRLLPGNSFEFILTSSEYGVRKPSSLLFEVALKKAGLTPDEVWYCGDSVQADVEGAANAGIFPVWYEDETMENPWRGQNAGLAPSCDHLHIHRWTELTDTLERLKNQKGAG